MSGTNLILNWVVKYFKRSDRAVYFIIKQYFLVCIKCGGGWHKSGKKSKVTDYRDLKSDKELECCTEMSIFQIDQTYRSQTGSFSGIGAKSLQTFGFSARQLWPVGL